MTYTLSYPTYNTIFLDFDIANTDSADTFLLALSPYIANLAHRAEQQFPDYITECVVSYKSVLISYAISSESINIRDSITDFIHTFCNQNNKKDNTLYTESQTVNIHHRIPVFYDTSVGWDLESMAEYIGKDIDSVIDLHTAIQYKVFAVGFIPNFPYLGFVDTQLQRKRLEKPRKHVPQYSVAVANKQTAIYPQNVSGGWHILGRSVPNFFRNKDTGTDLKFATGDTVSFYSIDKQNFLDMGGVL